VVILNLQQASFYHVPVLGKEAIRWWYTDPDGIYVDGTFGGGGHSQRLLDLLSKKARLLAFDRDVEAIANNPINDIRLTLIHHNYEYAANYARFLGWIPIHGVLLDLGVSSHQLDHMMRGFSYRGDGPLDMRMDRQQQKTAADVLNRYSVTELARIFRMWGDVPRAEHLAKAIVNGRRHHPWRTTGQLVSLALQYKPRSMKPAKFLSQVFQALRVEVNDEVGSLQRFLHAMAPLMAPGGRMVLITFQGAEDRTIKNFAKSELARRLGIRIVTKNVVRPSWEERKSNPRARSARMRVLERKTVR